VSKAARATLLTAGARGQSAYVRIMTWTDRLTPALAPSLDDFAALARRVFDELPADFRRQAGDVAFHIDDFAADQLLDDLGVEDPFELTGLHQGVDPGRRSIPDASPPTSTMFLYRRPILDEWCERGDVTLGELIVQVLVDELGKGAAAIEHAPIVSGHGWAGVRAPSLEDFVEVAGRALANLPPMIKAAVGDVQIRVEDFADDETLDALDIEDPFELTGVYEGVDLTRQSLLNPVVTPSSIRLFRRPILDEWSEGDVDFQSLVEHVFVHEVAHHFGFSDAGIEHVERS
jgi:predicted Zn-dependent protease with MMP-like domain